MTIELHFQVDAPSGQAYFSYNAGIFSGAGGKPENSEDDKRHSDPVELMVDGVSLTNGMYSFPGPTGTNGWKSQSWSGNSTLSNGAIVSVVVGSGLLAEIVDPGRAMRPFPPFCPYSDQASASYSGAVILHLSPVTTPQPAPEIPLCQLECDYFTWSTDIGSDTELSDPFVDGDECFDPGDMYAYASKTSIGQACIDGLQDDEDIFAGFDPYPDAPDGASPPASAAPVEQDQPIPIIVEEYFDLDGSDNLAIALSGLPLGQVIPTASLNSACLYSPEHLFISMDDDDPDHYTSSNPPSAPVSSGGIIYGETANQDEIIGLDLLPTALAQGLIYRYYGMSDEESLHPGLAPNPSQAEPEHDDDIDALDIHETNSGCDVWYISADHEARGFDPGSGLPLNPGIIYEVQPGGVIPVVDPVAHLAIPGGDEVDIDAFEFVSLFDPQSSQPALALLFSVDQDDPQTPEDESGGLDNSVIYYSFMDGTFGEFFDYNGNDIDALTAWCGPLYQQTLAQRTEPTLYIELTEYQVGSLAQSLEIFIGNAVPGTNHLLNWTATSSAPWITLTPDNGTGVGIMHADVDANTSDNPREATITIQAEGTCDQVVIVVHQSNVPKRGVDEIAADVPVRLLTPQPHPVAESTVFSFVLDDAADITLGIYDVTGRRVATLADGNFAAGEHHIEWSNGQGNGPALGAGVYELRLQVGDGFVTQRSFTLIR